MQRSKTPKHWPVSLLSFNEVCEIIALLSTQLLSLRLIVFVSVVYSDAYCIFISAKWTKGNLMIYCFHFCVSVCVCACLCVCVSAHSVHWFEWAEWRIVCQKCIRFVREKLRIFPYGQHIVGIHVSLAFWRYSHVQDRSGGWGEMYKNVLASAKKQAVTRDEVITLCCHCDNNHAVGTNI